MMIGERIAAFIRSGGKVGWTSIGDGPLGLVRVDGEIGPDRERTSTIRFMVDTGSMYTVVGQDLAAELGLQFPVRNTLVMADGASVDAPLGLAYLRIADREGGTIVAEMDSAEPLLGAFAMQSLGLTVNMIEEVLEFNVRYPPPV